MVRSGTTQEGTCAYILFKDDSASSPERKDVRPRGERQGLRLDLLAEEPAWFRLRAAQGLALPVRSDASRMQDIAVDIPLRMSVLRSRQVLRTPTPCMYLCPYFNLDAAQFLVRKEVW